MLVKSFTDVEAVLAGYVPPLRKFRSVYTLHNMRAIMDALGNPQDTYRTIHVAGTSGKTSTCYYIASLLKQTGKKVGLTVSPHVDCIHERVQIDLKPLADATYFAEFNAFMSVIEKIPIKPTYFEMLVAFAFWEFARQNVDYAVIEVGLGGLLDGTNVITNNQKISVITDIGLDHIGVLGSTLPEIAKQKAGIILPRSDAFCIRQADIVSKVFVQVARNHHARLHQVSPPFIRPEDHLPLYQQRNFYLAEKVADFTIVRDGLAPLSVDQKQQAKQVYIPARMEIIHQGDHTLILDAAHNQQKMQALVQSLKARYPNRKFVVLIALLDSADSRIDDVLDELLPITSHLIVTDFISIQDLRKQANHPQKVVDACHHRGFEAVEVIQDTDQAYQALKRSPENLRLITGSFYLLHDIHRIVGKL